MGLGVLTLTVVTRVEAQRRGFNRGFANAQIARPEDFDGRFHFCRVAFGGGGGFGNALEVDLSASRHQPLRPPVGAHEDRCEPRRNGDPNHLSDTSHGSGAVQLPLHHDD